MKRITGMGDISLLTTCLTITRLATGLCIHDAEISGLLISDPFLRLSAENLPTVAEDSLWTASSAAEWRQVIESRTSASQVASDATSGNLPQIANCRHKSGLGQYLELQSISLNIMDDWKRSGPRLSNHMEPLCRFSNQYLQGDNHDANNNFSLSLLWHSICISLFVDINRLELAVGKAGYEQAQAHWSYAHDWACSIAGHRCALHAALILRHLESMALATEPAIHVPRVTFHAALVWFSYCEFGRGNSGVLPVTAHFPEFGGLRIDCQKLLFEANSFKSVRPNVEECRTLYALIDVLERIGHWGISRKFAAILRVMVSEPVALS